MPNRLKHADEAVILCGGLGTRLASVVTDRPKAMVEIAGRPFLEWLLMSVRRAGNIRHVILATGHLSELIEDHFAGARFCGLDLSFSREPSPLGTAGALRLASALADSSPLLVMNGDSYCRFDLRALTDMHIRNFATATLWLSHAVDAARFGSVEIDVTGRVTGFREKTVSRRTPLVSAGIYLIDYSVVAELEPARQISLEHDVFPSLVPRGLYGVEGEEALVDIGTPESLQESNAELAGEFERLGCS